MSPTHRGVAELEAFAERFVANGFRIDVDDILVNGPPWRMRICVRATDGTSNANGVEVYNNRVVVFVEVRWGRIHRWEDYLDTERVRAHGIVRSEPTPACFGPTWSRRV